MSVASQEFVDAATTQANALGMEDAQRVFVNHPIQDATDEQMREKADQVVDRVIAALTS